MRIFGAGIAKSGTNSLATIFASHYRSMHEPDSDKLLTILLRRSEGDIDRGKILAHLREKDERLGLEVDSSQLNGVVIEELLELFDDGRFILTLREPVSWMDSLINHQLARPERSRRWRKWRDIRFGGEGLGFSPHERVLEDHGLYPIDGYLSHWASHNERVVRTVPAERLLVVRTHEIDASLERMAEWCGVPEHTLDQEQSHANPAQRRFGILKRIDEHFLKAKIQEHCAPLLRSFFPESAADQLA